MTLDSQIHCRASRLYNSMPSCCGVDGLCGATRVETRRGMVWFPCGGRPYWIPVGADNAGPDLTDGEIIEFFGEGQLVHVEHAERVARVQRCWAYRQARCEITKELMQ